MEKLQVSLDKIIPYTNARETFSQVLDRAQKDKYLVIARRYKPAIIIVSPKYFMQLKKDAEELRFKKAFHDAHLALADEFSAYLKKIGKDPYTIPEEEVEELLNV